MKLYAIWREINGKRNTGFINASGEEVISPRFQSAYRFREGLAAVEVHGKFGFIDTSGNEIIPCVFDRAFWFHNGYAKIVRNGAIGYISREGKVCLSHSYRDSSFDVREGCVTVWNDVCRYSQMTLQGEIVIEDNFSMAPFSDGLIPYANSLENRFPRFGFKNRSNEWAIPPHYTLAWSFSEGLAGVNVKVRSKELVAFIDRTGREVIPPGYESTGGKCREGLIQVWAPHKRGPSAGFINTHGEAVIPFIYDLARDFSEGLAVIRKGRRFGYVDRKGNEVVPAQFDDADDFDGDLALVKANGKRRYINTTGQTIWLSDLD